MIKPALTKIIEACRMAQVEFHDNRMAGELFASISGQASRFPAHLSIRCLICERFAGLPRGTARTSDEEMVRMRVWVKVYHSWLRTGGYRLLNDESLLEGCLRDCTR